MTAFGRNILTGQILQMYFFIRTENQFLIELSGKFQSDYCFCFIVL